MISHRQPCSSLPTRAASSLESTCRWMVAQFPDNPRSALFRWIDARDLPLVSGVVRTNSFNNAQRPLRDWRISMKYAIIGSGKIGTALARTFAHKNSEVAIANSRGPATLASLTKELGPSVIPQSLQDAHEADVIFLAVSFSAHKAVAKQFERGTVERQNRCRSSNAFTLLRKS